MTTPFLAIMLSALLAQATGPQPPSSPQEPQSRDLILRTNEAAKPLTVPRGYALVVGISKYEKLDPKNYLLYAETDAESVYRVLISKEGGAFPPENVHKLIGPDATKANFTRELEQWLPSVATDNDRVVVYFAGHGFAPGRGKGYLALWDIDPQNFEETGYSMARLGSKLQAVKALDKVLMVDACHSSKITRGEAEDVNGEIGQISRSFLTFTAARENESSYEDGSLAGGAGLFTYFLVRGLKGEADQNPCDGYVTADELVQYVRENVRQYAQQHGRSQTPQEYGDFQPRLVLALSQRCGSGAIASELKVGNLVVEANLDDTDVYVDDTPMGKVSPGTPLKVPGLAAGLHVVTGVRKGYENDSKQVAILPGQDQSVKLRIQYPREYKKKSRLLMEDGEKLLYSKKSALDLTQIYSTQSQSSASLEHARALFEEATAEDGNNARAFYDLGLTNLYLSDSDASLKHLRTAVKLDPAYVEARQQLAGELIESGDPDEAIRQLTTVTQLEPDNSQAYSLLSRAYYDKEVWALSVEAANHSIALSPKNEQAYLWRGTAIRQLAAADPNPAPKTKQYLQARQDFQEFLSLTKISNSALSQVAFYGIGFGMGSRSHADREQSYKAQRSIAYMGLCDCENHLKNPMRGIEFCQEAIRYDDKDPIGYFLLGNAYRDFFNTKADRETLLKARESYAHMLALNADLQESRYAKNYIEQIDGLLPKLKK